MLHILTQLPLYTLYVVMVYIYLLLLCSIMLIVVVSYK
jgi:hypothetical protein